MLPKFVGQPGQACADSDTRLFFLESTERAAKAICNTAPCRWRAECLQFVLQMTADRDRYGVWGGTTPEERRLLRRERATRRFARDAAQVARGAAQCVELWNQGWLIGDIAHHLGISYAEVYEAIDQAGVTYAMVTERNEQAQRNTDQAPTAQPQ
ncbi:hypothetical protein DLJ59_13065 [Micromonospora inaquosa]|uniref:4Fe-4S Wbl-type domain-containing protein n=1 Tax=Micromonospora inaquosa TaxID=2203716 RepID=A0A3N9X9U0_9ACTN|nr:hypothetical protein DLJ59_13065 [Micromonospora inaquosa]